MDKKSAIEIVGRFCKGIKTQGIRPNKVILYGSYATGTNKEGSDIDIVVISDDFKDKSYWERRHSDGYDRYEIFAPIEAVALTEDEWDNGDSFVIDYAQSGEVLFTA